MSQEMSQYLLYLRKSNGRKAVPRQRAITTAYIAKRGGIVLDEFPDADRTAFRKIDGDQPVRDEFARMLAVLRSRRGLIVAAYHADRLTRNDADTTELILVCAAGGHVIETPIGGIYDMATATGRKRFRDDASDAIFEVDHGRERVLAGRDDVAAQGRWLGGRRPLGWELDEHPIGPDGEPWLDEDGKPVNGILRLVPAEADAIRAAHDAVLAGAPLGAIARQWNAAGLTGTLGAAWTGREIRRILLRPRNAALMEHRGEITGKASWPAIVDEATHRAVVALLGDETRRLTPGPARVHLLSGIAMCGVCGRGLTAGSVAGKGRPPRPVYRCRGAGKGGQAHVARDAGALEDYVVRLVIERLSRDDAADLLRKDTGPDLAALHREKSAVEAAMRESNELRKAKLLTVAEFTTERAGHMAKLEEIAAGMEQVGQSDVLAPLIIRFREQAPGDYEGRLVIWEDYPLDTRRAVISALMTVRVLPQPKGRPKGWVPGEPYFDEEIAARGIEWKRQ